MKKIIFAALGIVALSFGAKAQQGPAVGPQISVNKETHDYGDIKNGGDPDCEFVVKNTGNAPLIISNAQGSCGCTVPQWSKEPIMPGKTSVIKVTYDTKRPGPINKSVTITSNAVNEPTMVLKIKGNVGPVSEEPAKVATPATPAKPATPATPAKGAPVKKKTAAKKAH